MIHVSQKFLTFSCYHTQRKTVEQAMKRIREAIHICLGAGEF